MAGISIPIVAEFDGKGINKAIKEFKQLETTTDKMGFAAQKAAKVAALGFAAMAASAAAVGAVLYKAAQAAAADEAAQKQLAASIKSSTTATDLQIKGVEQFIDRTQRQVGVADDQLRPAYGRLVRATGDVSKAQDLLNLSLNLSAATGKSVEATANAIAKAQEGAYGPLSKLGLGYDAATLKAAGFEKVQGMLEERFSGAAAAKANTYEGVLARVKITMGELQESIGMKVLPIMTELGNSFLRISEAVGKDGAAGGIKQLRQEIVSLGTDANGMQNTFGKIYGSIATFVNGVMNALAIPLAAINFLRTGNLGNYSPPNMPTWENLMKSTGGAGTSYAVTSQQAEAMFGVAPQIAPVTPASIPSAPSASTVTPPSTTGGGLNTGISGVDVTDIGSMIGGISDAYDLNLIVNAGIIASPATVGADIIDAILAAQRQNGEVFAAA